MSEPLIQLARDSRNVVTATMNRPEKNNAYNGALLQALTGALASSRNDDAVRALVVRGAGKHFQAGADLDWIGALSKQDSAANRAASALTSNTMKALFEFPVPTIALIQGACIGGGTGIAASCDIVIAEENAVFAISEARWGMIASIIFPQLVQAIGLRHARRYALSCERFDATQAKLMGFVHEVVNPGGLDVALEALLASLLRAGPEALRESKRLLLAHPDVQWHELEAAHAKARQSAEAAEGIMSFKQRRDPSWFSPTDLP
ncbi:MAG: enoyl-CoA hydratase-related protein [Pseudomonadota bacterium]